LALEFANLAGEHYDNNSPISLDHDCKNYFCMTCLLQFAEWAFGPGGLPNLMVIAFGDFTHGERFKSTQIVLSRDPAPSTTDARSSPRPFHVMGHHEYTRAIDQFDGARQMLRACPTEETFSYYIPSDFDTEDDETDDSEEDDSDMGDGETDDSRSHSADDHGT
jgi:hypothetical protein